MSNAPKKVRIVFPPSGRANIADWTVSVVLAITHEFVGLSWKEPVDADAGLVIFITSMVGGSQLDLDPIRVAERWGHTIFVVTGDEGTVSPAELGKITGEGRIWFFHTKMPVAQDGFLPFTDLRSAIQHVLLGLPLDDLGKE